MLPVYQMPHTKQLLSSLRAVSLSALDLFELLAYFGLHFATPSHATEDEMLGVNISSAYVDRIWIMNLKW